MSGSLVNHLWLTVMILGDTDLLSSGRLHVRLLATTS